MTLASLLLLLAAPGQAAERDVDRALLSPPSAPRDVRSDQILPDITGARATTASQVSTGPRSALPTRQLSDGRSAEASEPLSRPADGRGVPTARVVGQDRCDPSAGNAGVPVCVRPIETRARDYARPDPLVLSPEQRLLVDQRLRAGQPSGSPFAPRPDDAEKADPASPQAQTVAAIVRRDDDAAAAAAVAPGAAGALPAGVSPEALVVIDAILNQTPPR